MLSATNKNVIPKCITIHPGALVGLYYLLGHTKLPFAKTLHKPALKVASETKKNRGTHAAKLD